MSICSNVNVDFRLLHGRRLRNKKLNHQFMKVTTTFLLLCILSFGQITLAQDTLFKSNVQEVMALPVAEIQETVSSAAKTEQNINEAASLTNIVKRRQILDYGFFSLNQVLWQQAGFSVSRDFERYTPSFRGNYEGWNNNRMLVLIDGVPFNENISGSAWTAEGISPLLFAKSLEVVRGGVSALYGNNAMNGAIQIETMNPADIGGNVEARVRVGAGTQIFDLLTGVENSKLSAVIAYNRYQSTGLGMQSYDVSGRTDASGKLLQGKTNEDQENNYLFVKIKAKGKLQGLSFQFHEQQTELSTGHGWYFSIPDQPEETNFSRRVLALSYLKNIGDWRLEAVSRYQNSGFNVKIRFLPDSSTLGVLYPTGLTEHLKTSVNDIFTRLQMSRNSTKWGMGLLGWENTVYWYGKEPIHVSNANLDADFSPTANNQFINLPSAFAFFGSNVVMNNGFYGQYISPKLAKKFSFTAALRYDNQRINYTDIYDAQRPTLSKTYDQFSPRLTLVFTPLKNLTFRAIAGRSFRTPAISEGLTANSFIYASNIKQLKPEITDNYEIIADFLPNSTWHFRLNGFINEFQNLIYYSVGNGLLATNIYSAKSRGLESEIFYKKPNFQAFANMGYAQRISENIIDKSISESSEVTWVPAFTAKAGFTYRFKKIYVNTYLQYQGTVQRRSSDQADVTLYRPITVNTADYRPNQVAAWLNSSLKIGYAISKNIEISLWSNNLLNQEMFAAKYNAFTFDYQLPMRQVFFDLKINY